GGSFWEDWEDWEDWEKWESDISQNSQSSQNSRISKTVVLNDYPKYRNGLSKMVLLQCRPCRTGIGTSLAEREHCTGKHSAHRCLECPKCCLKILNLEMPCAQRHSKVSESDGCPSGYAGRIGKTVSAQRHSKVSESDGCPSGYAGRMGENGFVAVPSVSGGPFIIWELSKMCWRVSSHETIETSKKPILHVIDRTIYCLIATMFT
ncbi:MAG: hypothetical protein WCV67_20410, partial [Victivallaceae bacterium]